jgi:hypothetical protein
MSSLVSSRAYARLIIESELRISSAIINAHRIPRRTDGPTSWVPGSRPGDAARLRCDQAGPRGSLLAAALAAGPAALVDPVLAIAARVPDRCEVVRGGPGPATAAEALTVRTAALNRNPLAAADSAEGGPPGKGPAR